MILASVTHDPKWASRVKSVFDTRAGSGYKDDIPFKYYFAIVTSRKRSVRWATGSSIESHDGAEVGRATSLWRRSPALNAILPIQPHSYAIVTDLLAFEDVVPPRRDIGFYETMLSDLAIPDWCRASSAEIEPRFYDYSLRRHLFEADPVCKICGNQILSFDDCTVDHIVPYSRNGRTVPENAQLAHRYCNASKNAFKGQG